MRGDVDRLHTLHCDGLRRLGIERLIKEENEVVTFSPRDSQIVRAKVVVFCRSLLWTKDNEEKELFVRWKLILR